ncbi:MAG: cyclic nucleotide-binding domain-containing protein [Pseudomonadota bacterium]
MIEETTKQELLKKQKVFARLNHQEIEILATLFREQDIKSGTTIVTEGEHVDSVYLILEGKADVRHVTLKDGQLNIQSLTTVGQGGSIGLSETGFYSLTGLRTATVVALTDMVVLRLSIAAFNGFALAYPHVKEMVSQKQT